MVVMMMVLVDWKEKVVKRRTYNAWWWRWWWWWWCWLAERKKWSKGEFTMCGLELKEPACVREIGKRVGIENIKGNSNKLLPNSQQKKVGEFYFLLTHSHVFLFGWSTVALCVCVLGYKAGLTLHLSDLTFINYIVFLFVWSTVTLSPKMWECTLCVWLEIKQAWFCFYHI